MCLYMMTKAVLKNRTNGDNRVWMVLSCFLHAALAKIYLFSLRDTNSLDGQSFLDVIFFSSFTLHLRFFGP